MGLYTHLGAGGPWGPWASCSRAPSGGRARREVVLRARRDLQEKVQALRQAADALQALAGREPDTLSAPEARRLSGLDAACRAGPPGPSPTPGGEPDPA